MLNIQTRRTHFKALGDGEGDGTFEAIVAVFSNVDHQNDRIVPGAFAGSIAEWKASGDPIPVIYTHKWDDLAAHIGEISDLVELMPGSPLLPKALQPFGGLLVKGVLDIDEDVNARKVYKMLKRRRIKEWSFAYDVLEERPGEDGANELVRLGLIEVGPTLKGANSLTTTVAVKAQEAAAPPPAKAYVPIDGSFEDRREKVAAAVRAAAAVEYGDDIADMGVYVEATFDDRAVVAIYDYRSEAAADQERFVEYAYTIDAAGAVTLGESRPVALAASVVPKARAFFAKEGRRNSTADADRLQSLHDTSVELGAKCASVTEPKTAEPKPVKSEEPGRVKDDEPRRIDPLTAQLAVLELSAL